MRIGMFLYSYYLQNCDDIILISDQQIEFIPSLLLYIFTRVETLVYWNALRGVYADEVKVSIICNHKKKKNGSN